MSNFWTYKDGDFVRLDTLLAVAEIDDGGPNVGFQDASIPNSYQVYRTSDDLSQRYDQKTTGVPNITTGFLNSAGVDLGAIFNLAGYYPPNVVVSGAVGSDTTGQIGFDHPEHTVTVSWGWRVASYTGARIIEVEVLSGTHQIVAVNGVSITPTTRFYKTDSTANLPTRFTFRSTTIPTTASGSVTSTVQYMAIDLNGSVASTTDVSLSLTTNWSGWTNSPIRLTNRLVYQVGTTLLTSIAGVRLLTTGVLQRRNGGSYTAISGEWRIAGALTGFGSGYEVRATKLSGSLTSGTVGSWLVLSANQEWYCRAVMARIRLEIRAVGQTTVLATADIDLESEFNTGDPL